MAEPPYKRARRPDSSQMWEESDRRAPGREERQDRGDRRDRDRRYRSRSPRDSRGGDRERDRPVRDTRDSRGERGGRRDYRERERGMYPAEAVTLSYRSKPNTQSQDGGRDTRERPRERSRDRARDSKRDTRSRSPRRDRERERDVKKEVEVEKEIPKPFQAEEEFAEARTATPPVSFKVTSTSSGQDHERMEVDGDAQPAKKGKKGKKAAKPVDEDDDDLVIEDDGMAAMQAMMGFGGFGTTHQQKVAGNDIYAVRKEKKTEYRQYMNRVGGFNRPLSPSHE